MPSQRSELSQFFNSPFVPLNYYAPGIIMAAINYKRFKWLSGAGGRDLGIPMEQKKLNIL